MVFVRVRQVTCATGMSDELSAMNDRLVQFLARSWKVRELYSRLAQTQAHSHIRRNPGLTFSPSPYAAERADDTNESKSPLYTAHGAFSRPALFLTSRFRTGSTFLWQLMNAIDGVTCYYEPLNARVWVKEAEEPRAASGAGARVDPSHKGVQNYAAQYAGLSHLAAHHSAEWSTHNLWMDAQSFDWPMRRYLAGLIDAVPGYPVLQFNRVDFRLRWLRCQFPAAKIVHLIRNPRAQWHSSLFGQKLAHDITVADFDPFDRFYLGHWTRDLAGVFPILNAPPDLPAYGLFYLLWRLSDLHGRAEADLTIRYEDLLGDITSTLDEILALMNSAPAGPQSALSYDADTMRAMIAPPEREKWKDIASEDWFTAIETEMDDALRALLTPDL